VEAALAQAAAPRIAQVAPPIEVVVVLAWATATFWFPLMPFSGLVGTASRAWRRGRSARCSPDGQ
jgi:hypothetical protein